MCGGPESLKSNTSSSRSSPSPSPSSSPPSPSPSPLEDSKTTNKDMNHLTVETDVSLCSLLELAANNDLDGFKRLIERDISAVDEIELWYGRQKGSKQMVLEHRTPLMVAATYGSVDVLKLILALSQADVNCSCGPDRSTALHCAASGGSVNAIDVVKLLLHSGANVNSVDADGRRPADVIVVSPRFPDLKTALEELLTNNRGSSDAPSSECNLRISTATSITSSPPLSSSPDNGSPSSASDSTSSPMTIKLNDLPVSSAPEKKEYPIDPSLPDIKNSIYATDEFRMFSFKVRPCSRAYSHDWTECPFVHPGENARRRDPRKFHYSCVPCPDFRKGACRRGDMCEYAHGVFECWLHPAQYRTRLCKDGTSCMRRVCFFAHTSDELRPLYVSTGSAVPSPRSTASAATVMDMAAAMSLLPGSPSSVSVMSPSPFTPPMSPSANGISHSSLAWPQPNVPTLHLPGSNLQSSRLRSSLNARDIPADDYNLDFEIQHQQLLNDLACLSQQPRLSSSSSLNRPIRTKTLTPSNLEDLFTAEISLSPRYSDQAAAAFSPSHKSNILNQFQQQQSMLSPINTSVFSPKNVDHHPLLQNSFGLSSPGRMSPRSMETLSPMGSRLSAFAQREKQQQQLRSLSSRELGSNAVGVVGSPVNSWSKWGSPTGKLDWTVHGDELGRFRRGASSTEMGNNGEEPDLSWVQTLVKESPPEMKEKLTVPSLAGGGGGGASSGEGSNLNSQGESNMDHSVLGAWLEQMQLDPLVT
ncbi:zinc finger protein [Macleaya cordata]|uniref:Zinc finger protein n=1 Tax=Macleaya cordata TaxID=56857 RepID=A0A200R3A7_MACCD|nr:zinc finger protein [Macleaya cordata]